MATDINKKVQEQYQKAQDKSKEYIKKLGLKENTSIDTHYPGKKPMPSYVFDGGTVRELGTPDTNQRRNPDMTQEDIPPGARLEDLDQSH